jgi:hypothetical protein
MKARGLASPDLGDCLGVSKIPNAAAAPFAGNDHTERHRGFAFHPEIVGPGGLQFDQSGVHTIGLARHIARQSGVESRVHRMPFIKILEPDVDGSRAVIDFEIQYVDGAKRKAEILIVIIGLFQLEGVGEFSNPSDRDMAGECRLDALIPSKPQVNIDVLVKVLPATRQIVPQMSQGDWLGGEPCDDGRVYETPWTESRAKEIQLQRTVRFGLHVRPTAARGMSVVDPGMESRRHTIRPDIACGLLPEQRRTEPIRTFSSTSETQTLYAQG